jgi:hypothetical protein
MKADVDQYRMERLLFSSGEVKVQCKRCFHGQACEMKLAGQLNLANQDEVMRRVQLNLLTVNAALIDFTGMGVDDGEADYSFGDISQIAHQAAIVLVVTKKQRPKFESYIQSRTRHSLTRMIFTEDLILKARSWTEFYSRLGIAR